MDNENIRNHFDAFERIKAFGVKHEESFEAGNKALDKFATMAAMELAGVRKLTGTGNFRGGTESKALRAERLRELLKQIQDTAELVAEDEDMPEFDDKFRMPSSTAHEVLMTAGRSFLQEASENSEYFSGYGLSATFLTDLDGLAHRRAGRGG